MYKNERFLTILGKTKVEIQKALDLLEKSYNDKKYLLNKDFNTYAVYKIVEIQQLIEDINKTYYKQ